jgi:two-component system LytT family response regulator
MTEPRPASRAVRAVRAVVVDDEPAARDVIRTLLGEHAAVEVVGEATNGVEAVEIIRRTRPDLLFLDIQMPDQDGFSVLAALGADVPRGVIFVTAHDEHAIRAFEVHALDYLLKPFGRPRFGAAVVRAVERLGILDSPPLRPTLESMAHDRRDAGAPAAELAVVAPEAIPGRGAPPRRLGVRVGAKTLVVSVESIDWVEAVGDYARIHAGAKSYLVTQRMNALERLLDTGEFLRIHRSLIVNVARVRELHRDADGGGTIVLHDGVRLRVARGRWSTLHAALEMEEF